MSGRKKRDASIRSKVINILVTGYQKVKEPQKRQAFVMVVTWNNGERYEIYRKYSEIFNFHTALKEFNPKEAGREEEERTIPPLPKINFVLRNQATWVTETKLEQYNLYCRTVISMDPNISESAHVLGFFSYRSGDKELPTVQFRRPVSATLQEFPVTKTEEELGEEHYALVDFTGEDASQISFKAGDKVFVKTKDESGWWLCKVNGRMGWAPPTYLKKKEAEVTIHVDRESKDTERDDLERSVDSDGYITLQPSFRRIVLPVVENYQERASATANLGQGENGSPDAEVMAEEYVTIESYQADGPGQVSFKEGEKAHVLEKLEDGWWFVSIGDQEGWAPCSYLERLNGEDEDEEETIITLENIEKYYAVDDYEAVEDDEISFPEGAVVDVMQKRLDGWWLVRYEDQTGLAPGTFLRKGLPLELPDLPTISKDRESDPLPVPDSKRQEALAYENVQLQMMRAQPPRRKSMRQWVKSKNSRAPAVLPRQSSSPSKKEAADYINHQPHLLGADLNVEQEEVSALKSNTIGTTRELVVPQRLEEKQYHGSIQEVLQGKGGVKNKVKGFETDSTGANKGQIPIMMMKPNMPKARLHKRNPAETGVDRVGERYALNQQAQPRIKPRTKLPSKDPVRDDSPPPPLPPRASRKSPSHVTSPMSMSSSHHVSSPTRRSPPNITYSSHHDVPPPLGPGHPLRSHDLSHDQSPPLGPSHPLKSDDADLPRNPPRPTASVIQRAKDNQRREKSPRLLVPSNLDDLDSVHSSPTATSTRSYPRNRPKQKVKKTRSQTSADRFQDAHPARGHQSISRMRSENATTESVYSTTEAPPQNGEVGGASGEGGVRFSDDFTSMLIKHILESNDPSLKAKLKNVLENNDDIRNSLADMLQ